MTSTARPSAGPAPAAAAIIAAAAVAFDASAADKVRVENLDELPRFSYPIDGSVVGIITSDEAFDAFATQVRSDVEGVLAKYEIDETENRRKNGDRIWMAWRNTPILNEDGSLREILTIGIDITERRRARGEG